MAPPPIRHAYHSPVLLPRHLFRVARLDRLDAVLAAIVIVLACLSAAVVFFPMLGGQHVEAGLDLVLDTFATVVALGVAVVAWVRYREIGAPVALFQASAFLVLAIADRRRGLKPFRDCRFGFPAEFPRRAARRLRTSVDGSPLDRR